MDFIEALTIQLRVPEGSAKAMAGQLLELMERTVRERVSFGLASRVRDAVPELTSWQAATPMLAPGALHFREVPLPSPLGGEAELDQLLERWRIPPGEHGLVRSLVVQFLSSRLAPETMGAVLQAMPALAP
jgi:hypothetical protein